MADPDPFLALQPRLLGIAYRMLGSAADAVEELVQDAYLRWHGVLRDQIRSPEAFLVTTVTRLALDRLELARTKREVYVGPWLPEPVPETWPGHTGDLESITLGFLVLLEKLSPLERAVLVLHEAFDYEHKEIATILERSETACRQLLKRAKERLREERPRYRVDKRKHKRLLEAFLKACRSGEVQELSELLKEDVVFISDGGGRVDAATKPLRGRELVARFILSQMPKKAGLRVELQTVNGRSAIISRSQDGMVEDVLDLDLAEGRIARIHAIRNPEKLERLCET